MFSLHRAVDYSTGLTSFAHINHHSDDNADENDSTDDGSPKCRRIVGKPFYRAATIVAVIVRTLVIACATISVYCPLANPIGTLLVI